MPFVARAKPDFETSGQFRFDRLVQDAACTFRSPPAQLRGRDALKGCCILPPEVAADAFGIGDGYVRLEGDAREYRVKAVAHSTGSATLYIEIRI